MAELYNIGINRISYRASKFALGKVVTAYIWAPSLAKSGLLTLTEVGEGLYYLDYDFQAEGTYLGKFFEDGQSSTSGVFRVSSLASQLTTLSIKAKTDNLPPDPATEAAVNAKASQISVDGKPTLSQIEASGILAKEATVGSRASQTSVDGHRAAVEPNIDARVSTRATPQDIKDFSLTRVLVGPRNLELIAKSVSQYYREQVGTLVVMSRFAGLPTDVDMFATIYYPDDEIWQDEVAMDPLGETGLYTHNFLIPADAPEGVYKVKYKAVKLVAEQQLPDPFTEPDGAPSNWTVFQGTWNVVSNVLEQTASGYAYAHWDDSLAVDWADYTFEYDTRADTDVTNFILGIIARYKSTALNYKFYYSKYRDRLCLDKGTGSIMEKAKTLVWNQWHKFKIELVGPRVRCYLDDALEFEWVDLNPITTGVPTLYCAGPSSFDDALIVIPAQEYQEFEITDFMVGTEPVVVADLAGIEAKVDKLPDDPTSKSDLEATHGAGSWEGAVEFVNE